MDHHPLFLNGIADYADVCLCVAGLGVPTFAVSISCSTCRPASGLLEASVSLVHSLEDRPRVPTQEPYFAPGAASASLGVWGRGTFLFHGEIPGAWSVGAPHSTWNSQSKWENGIPFLCNQGLSLQQGVLCNLPSGKGSRVPLPPPPPPRVLGCLPSSEAGQQVPLILPHHHSEHCFVCHARPQRVARKRSSGPTKPAVPNRRCVKITEVTKGRLDI